MTIPDGLVWLHCTGPDGPVVLLGDHDSRAHRITLCDDHCTYFLEGQWLHKWRVYHAKAVVRPPPAPFHEGEMTWTEHPILGTVCSHLGLDGADLNHVGYTLNGHDAIIFHCEGEAPGSAYYWGATVDGDGDCDADLNTLKARVDKSFVT